MGTRKVMHMSEGVSHAFSNDTNAARSDRAGAELAWEWTVGSVKRHLRS